MGNWKDKRNVIMEGRMDMMGNVVRNVKGWINIVEMVKRKGQRNVIRGKRMGNIKENDHVR